MTVYAVSITLQLGDEAIEGPGWYLVGNGEDNFKLKLTKYQASQIFESIEKNSENLLSGPLNLFEKGNKHAAEAITKKLKEAQTLVSAIPNLQANLAEFE